MASFAPRLNHLFDRVYPVGSAPHSDAGVAAALTATGTPVSAGYLALLRAGLADPDEATERALAHFFKVKPDYFHDAVYAAKIDYDLDILEGLRSHGLRRLSNRAVDLSVETQSMMASLAAKLRARHG